MEELVKSPIFYMGNKYKLLPQLLPLIPDNIETFYDLFGGSGCMCNVPSKKYVYNELNDNIVALYKLFTTYTPEELIEYIEDMIKTYDLNTEGTDVRQNTPGIEEIREHYNNNYIKFREAYNKSDRDYRMLYTLTFYSFSNLIRFNAESDFNMPFGNRCFCEKHKEQIHLWCRLLKTKDIEIRNENAFDILKSTKFKSGDFVYLDPPYSNTLAIYNEQRAFGGWSIEDDYELFSWLEELDKQGVKWGLSNVFENKGNKNNHLEKWCEDKGWYVHHLNFTYSSLGKGNANSDEVYICNYKVDKPMFVKYSLWDELL